MTDSVEAFEALLGDERVNVALIGPGAGTGEKTCQLVHAALRAKKAVVLDADALTSFAEFPQRLFGHIKSACILTPHMGEFRRLFSGIDAMKSKVEQAREAAKLSQSIVVLKGADTVIAAPDGLAVVNTNAPPDLATAGSGDVLAGICAGLMAQGLPAFEAACAGVWMHGAAAAEFGVGLIAEDLVDMLPSALHSLRAMRYS